MKTYIIDKKSLAALGSVLAPENFLSAEKARPISAAALNLIEVLGKLIPPCRELSAGVTHIQAGVTLALSGLAHEAAEESGRPQVAAKADKVADLEATLRVAKENPAAFITPEWIEGLKLKIEQEKSKASGK